MTRLIGYTRELIPGDLAADADRLSRAGAVEISREDRSAELGARPMLQACLASLEAGDTLVVTSAARLSHSVPFFVSTMSLLTVSDVKFRSLHEPALSTNADRKVDPAEVFAALEGLRRRLVSVQTRAGMVSAAAAGRRPGRPTVMTPERIAMAVELRNIGRSNTHIARVLGVSANAVQRALARSVTPIVPPLTQ